MALLVRAAMLGLVAALIGIWSRMHPTGSSQLHIAPNGGGDSFAVDIQRREDLHRVSEREPNRLGSGAGVEQTYTERDGMAGGEPSGTLYAVWTFPFVWPPRSTRVDGATDGSTSRR